MPVDAKSVAASTRKPVMRNVFKTEDGYVISVSKGAIMNSEREDEFARGLSLPHLPDMLFVDNQLELLSPLSNSSLTFSPKEALTYVNTEESLNNVVKVASAEEWQMSRQSCPHISKVVNPTFDWTYTPTGYSGSMSGRWSETESSEGIDYEKLKEREPILFFDHLILYEDELDDNGCSVLSVKVRAMRSGFLVLLRFFLRVDGTLVRVHETRLYHATHSPHIIKERCIKEAAIKDLEVSDEVLKDADELSRILPTKSHIITKLSVSKDSA